MRIPHPPVVSQIRQISPSLYEAALHCKARAVWMAHGDQYSMPHHPKAILGMCLHAVSEEANNGGMNVPAEDGFSKAARELFDRHANRLYERAHPLLRAKFATPLKIPYYYLYRERAVAEAEVASNRTPLHIAAAASGGVSLRRQAETKFSSRDGLIVGRPDLIDLQAAEVVDYKTGAAPNRSSNGISEAEGRQLRLYVHLALENGLAVDRGTIMRADGSRSSLGVSKDDAAREGRRARELLKEINDEVGKTFEEIATPTAHNCAQCPCIPLCEPFWRSAQHEWVEQAGFHVEGRVLAIEESIMQGVELVTLQMDALRGTFAADNLSIQHVPKAWLTAGGSTIPRENDRVRVVHGRLVSAGVPPVGRVDRAATSIWTVSEA